MIGSLFRCTVQAAAEASYVYVTTKSVPEGRKLQKVTVGVADANAVRQGFAHGLAAVAGIEMAKEWGNRPANQAPMRKACLRPRLVNARLRSSPPSAASA